MRQRFALFVGKFIPKEMKSKPLFESAEGLSDHKFILFWSISLVVLLKIQSKWTGSHLSYKIPNWASLKENSCLEVAECLRSVTVSLKLKVYCVNMQNIWECCGQQASFCHISPGKEQCLSFTVWDATSLTMVSHWVIVVRNNNGSQTCCFKMLNAMNAMLSTLLGLCIWGLFWDALDILKNTILPEAIRNEYIC